MKTISPQDMLDAAAYGLISARCRQAYLHDMRGELQTLHSAVDLMVRASRGAPGNADVAEKASSLAKRTMANYENSIVKLVDQMAPQFEARRAVDVAELVASVERLVRNDAARKAVRIALHSTPPLTVVAETNKFRLYLVGLITATLDGLAAGSVIDITVHRSGGDALIEVASDMPRTLILDPDSLWQNSQPQLAPYALFLMLAKQWVIANGGQLELAGGNPLPNVLRILYPAAAP